MSAIQCKCGKVELSIDMSASGSWLKCCCNSCRGFSKYLGEVDRLDEFGAVELFQTTPSRVAIVKGKDKLKAYIISEKGIQRWYCANCNTHMANTLQKTKIAFIGLPLPKAMDKAEFGNFLGYVQTKFSPNAKPKNEASFLGAGLKIMWRSLRAKKQSDWQEGGNWIASPELMDEAERQKLYELAKAL